MGLLWMTEEIMAICDRADLLLLLLLVVPK
jgi:hypothetical protein